MSEVGHARRIRPVGRAVPWADVVRSGDLLDAVGAPGRGWRLELGPIVPLFDDLHWADEVRLRLLSLLGRRSPAWPVRIVGTVREEELETAPVLARALDELEAEGHLLRVTLSPLSRGETLILARALMCAGHDVDAVARPGEHVRAHARTSTPFR